MLPDSVNGAPIQPGLFWKGMCACVNVCVLPSIFCSCFLIFRMNQPYIGCHEVSSCAFLQIGGGATDNDGGVEMAAITF